MIWRPNVTVAAVVTQEQRFLFVEEHSEGRLVLNQPAGHLEEGESLIQAVTRETLEETAYHFVPEALVGVYRWQNRANAVTYLRFAFSGRIVGHEAGQPLDHGIARALWLTADEITACPERHRSPQVAKCVADYLDGSRYPLDLLRDLI